MTKNGLGVGLAITGVLLGSGGALIVVIWTLWASFNAFGLWTVIVGILAAPITYLGALLIVWFATGVFPVSLLILWLSSLVGFGLFGIGSHICKEN